MEKRDTIHYQDPIWGDGAFNLSTYKNRLIIHNVIADRILEMPQDAAVALAKGILAMLEEPNNHE